MIDANLIPRNYVPGFGPRPATVMLVGEAPGRHENFARAPFVGQSGEELDRYMASAGLSRYDCYTTNLYKYWPLLDFKGKQLPPSPEQIKEGETELLMEISIVRPKFIAAIGAHSARWFLGSEFKSMRRDFGIPRPWPRDPSITIVPITHPAAGLHQDREQTQIQRGFQLFGQIVRGEIPAHPPVDEYPNPEYIRISDDMGSLWDGGADFVSSVLAGRTVIAIDTEGTIADPWCLTFCVEPGRAYLVRSTERECLAAIDRHINAPGGACTVICHYLAHDLPVASAMGVRIDRHRAIQSDGSLSIRDTMSEAFLLGGIEPKGLKPLGWRLLGRDMKSYEELVGPTEEETSRRYIESIYETFKCGDCGGSAKGEKRKTHNRECAECSGTGKVAGKRAGTTKQCKCVKTVDRCESCIDGLVIPMPDKEMILEADGIRWKQPQSMGKWVKRRLKRDETAETDAESPGAGGPDDGADSDDEPAVQFFKLRREWHDLGDRSDRQYVEAIVGRIPRTTLSEVEAREGEEAVTDYACADAEIAFRIAPILERRLASLGLLAVREQDAAFIPMVSRMEQTGMRIDRPHFEAFARHLEVEIDRNRRELGALLGLDRATNPTRDLVADLLFRELKLPTIKLTKSGTRESVDDDVLGALKAHLSKRAATDPAAEFAIKVIDHVSKDRELTKLDSSYVRKILKHADRIDRLHTTLDYTVAATGRLTSSEPINAQTFPNPDNYPKELENDWELNYGLRTRAGIIAKKGCKLAALDYSQIEMVTGAHLTQDPGMLDVFRRGLDLHYYAASMMFGIPYDQVSKALRTQIKPLNFGAFYGLSAIGLQAQFASFPSGAIEKSEAECQELIDRYYRAFPGVLEWKERLWESGERDGFVRDLFGRIRWVPGLRSNIKKVRAAAEREAANMPIQSTANGIIRIASRKIWEHDLPGIWSLGVDAEVIMQTHDENVVEAEEEHIGWIADVLGETMRTAVELSVPIKVGVKIGDNLAEVK